MVRFLGLDRLLLLRACVSSSLAGGYPIYRARLFGVTVGFSLLAWLGRLSLISREKHHRRARREGMGFGLFTWLRKGGGWMGRGMMRYDGTMGG